MAFKSKDLMVNLTAVDPGDWQWAYIVGSCKWSPPGGGLLMLPYICKAPSIPAPSGRKPPRKSTRKRRKRKSAMGRKSTR